MRYDRTSDFAVPWVPGHPGGMHKTTGVRDPAAAFPLPGTRDDAQERRQANRAITVSAIGLDRAEDLAGIAIAVVIWASAAFAGYESIRKLLDHGTTGHVALGIAGAALGIAGNQVVARYKLTVGRRIKSATLVADARHSWLDALSSA